MEFLVSIFFFLNVFPDFIAVSALILLLNTLPKIAPKPTHFPALVSPSIIYAKTATISIRNMRLYIIAKSPNNSLRSPEKMIIIAKIPEQPSKALPTLLFI
ncbi:MULTISPECIES: hypothetical protein [Streptococcus]|uniref:hypothetical protein n=1 Tax=Streptococcus TaxID=1301 RepID=UPI001EF48D9B|nr:MULTISPECIES: hypothetical protein [Streptococcus]